MKIPYGKQHITKEDVAAVVESLNSELITQGAYVPEFEKQFAKYIGSRYAVAVSNGTAALHLAAMALDVEKGTKVITSPITFAASANCIPYCGGEVEFADIDPETGVLDINAVRSLLEKSPKGTYSGIIPVDFAGYPVDLEAFRELADEYDLWIIEDACHAPGGYFYNTKGVQQNCGNCAYADMAIFSFHPVKHIACGEGGMITTNDEKLYQKLIMLRTHGITKNPDLLLKNDGGWYYEMQELGYNYRLTDIQAALGISQLSRAEAGIQRRKQIAAQYDKAFQGLPINILQTLNESYGHAYHLYIIQVDDRKTLYNDLRQKGIFAQVHYIPVHTMPYYQRQGHQQGDMPNAEAYYNRCLSLPMYPSLTDEEQSYVIEKVKEFCLCDV